MANAPVTIGYVYATAVSRPTLRNSSYVNNVAGANVPEVELPRGLHRGGRWEKLSRRLTLLFLSGLEYGLDWRVICSRFRGSLLDPLNRLSMASGKELQKARLGPCGKSPRLHSHRTDSAHPGLGRCRFGEGGPEDSHRGDSDLDKAQGGFGILSYDVISPAVRCSTRRLFPSPGGSSSKLLSTAIGSALRTSYKKSWNKTAFPRQSGEARALPGLYGKAGLAHGHCRSPQTVCFPPHLSKRNPASPAVPDAFGPEGPMTTSSGEGDRGVQWQEANDMGLSDSRAKLNAAFKYTVEK
ncbi:hypothetical protein UY3_12715 [Chelonia mydas]|uniref:Uncharacterized protein n=1 Tax=Chelonia mydas TaxID=8469 RepID=M7AXB9_CHEMY|nr:hypothetical protein UY3_12715 [Chelonia mydas]